MRPWEFLRRRPAVGRGGGGRSGSVSLVAPADPSGGVYSGIVRRMRPTRDGALLIHQSSTNRIILVW